MAKGQGLTASIVLCAALLLSACGFQPLYGTRSDGSSVATALSQVQIEASGDEYSRPIGFALEDRMLNRGTQNPAYRLSLSSSVTIGDVAVEQNTDVTRKNVTLATNYTLIENESGETVFTRRARSITAYNRVTSEFSNLVAERDAIERASQQIATTIEQDLAVYFNRQSQ